MIFNWRQKYIGFYIFSSKVLFFIFFFNHKNIFIRRLHIIMLTGEFLLVALHVYALLLRFLEFIQIKYLIIFKASDGALKFILSPKISFIKYQHEKYKHYQNQIIAISYPFRKLINERLKWIDYRASITF